MGFYTTTLEPKTAPRKTPSCSSKTASRNFFSYPVKTSYKNRSNSLKTSQENPNYSYKTASGRSSWPSRDPLGDKSFLRSQLKIIYNKARSFLEAREKAKSLRDEGRKNLYMFSDNMPLDKWDSLGLMYWRCRTTRTRICLGNFACVPCAGNTLCQFTRPLPNTAAGRDTDSCPDEIAKTHSIGGTEARALKALKIPKPKKCTAPCESGGIEVTEPPHCWKMYDDEV